MMNLHITENRFHFERTQNRLWLNYGYTDPLSEKKIKLPLLEVMQYHGVENSIGVKELASFTLAPARSPAPHTVP